MSKNHPSKSFRDLNLLFGVMAVQLRFIKPSDLARAAALWAAAPEKEIGSVLVDMGLLDPDKKEEIDRVIAMQLRDHEGDASSALASFGGGRAVQESFAASIVVHEESVGAPLESFGGDAVPKKDGPAPGQRLDDTERITLEHPGRYTVKGEYGRGGIGRVLLAFDEHIGREVALKELLPPSPGSLGSGAVRASDKGARAPSPAYPSAATARFMREARITGQLEHPGIVPVYEIARRTDGSLFYTMKLVRGVTLFERLRKSKSLSDRLSLIPHFLALCQAVAYAHAKDVIHRDLKPANVMVGEFGETVVLDWGLAKVKGLADVRAGALEESLRLIREAGAQETLQGQPIGTPAYMSMEQAEGRIEDIDEKSDVWSLGAILYEILTGRPPFTGDNAYEVMGKVIKDPVIPAAELVPEAPPELCAIAGRCLEKDRDKRYRDAKQVADDVARFESGGLVSAYQYSMAALAKRWLIKRWPVVATAALALAALLALGTWSYLRIRNEKKSLVASNYQKAAALARARSQEKEARRALSDSYLMLGRYYEARGQWDKAISYFAAALNEDDTLEARYSISYARLLAGKGVIAAQVLPGQGAAVSTLAVSPDGSMLASGAADGAVDLWDLAAGLKARSLGGQGGAVMCLALTPDGKTLVSGSKDKTIKLWDTAGGELLRSLQVNDLSRAMAISPDGNMAAYAGAENTIKIIALSSGNLLLTLRGHVGGTLALALTPDNKTLASGGMDNLVKLWDLASGNLLHSLEGHKGPVISIAFSQDGKTLASGGADKSIIIWDAAGGRLTSLETNVAPATALALSPDAKVLAWSGRDAPGVELRDAGSGEYLHILGEDSGAAAAIAISSDGKSLMSGNVDGTITIRPFTSASAIGDAATVRGQAEQETGLAVKGMYLYLADPKTGKPSNTSMPLPF